ncbi:uncharacterized protein LOC124134397 isoform X2 [Haliotis rufescens]|uniref:uncharacterized protein LOC124134397 isoform X2 n=1 Tax=Haliotis rufescens TaxID=6454 RepID=UPI00201F86E5|nr:uncharacterized protein LOC124134397 isoform X2 [Haliotis rufescens]
MHLLEEIVCVLTAVTHVAGDYGKRDFRYMEDGVTKWCVYGTARDIEQYGSESQCTEKVLPVENHTLNGKEERFYARLASVEGGRNRYIKNCTAPPNITGADVDCRDYNGNVVVRVYDTCRVNCVSPGKAATQATTTCQTDGQWEDVNCVPHSCRPLENFMRSDGNASCDTAAWLPLNSTCSVTCPPDYEPASRVFQCVQGLWDILKTCAPRAPVSRNHEPEAADDWKIPTLCIGLFLVLLVIGICIYYMYRRKHRKKRDLSLKNPKMENVSLLPTSTSPSSSSSSSSVITSTGSSSRSEGSEQLSQSEVVVDVGEGEGESDGLSTDEEAKELPPSYRAVMCEDLVRNGDVCGPGSCEVRLWYCYGDDQWIPLSPENELAVAEETVLSINAHCSKGHDILRLKCGPPFSDYQEWADRMTVTIKRGDAGSFLLWTQCSHLEDLVVVVVNIQLTDVTGNVDHTNVKEVVRAEVCLGSLANTVQEATIDASSGPSQPLKAELTSLPSDPCLYKSSLTDIEERVGGGARAVGRTMGGANPKAPLRPARSVTSLASRNSIPPMNDEESESCTLRLSELRERRDLKKICDDLVLKLQPTNDKHINLTICGAAMDILGFSNERVNYVTWARREDLRNSPAHVILTYMIQKGTTACHLVRYFADPDHHRVDIIRLLQTAHPDCPACRKYYIYR